MADLKCGPFQVQNPREGVRRECELQEFASEGPAISDDSGEAQLRSEELYSDQSRGSSAGSMTGSPGVGSGS